MQLKFYGAARTVTGSCHCLEACGKRILVDCGLQQGKDELGNEALHFDPRDIDYVIVTHAHIDHSGRIPLLTKRGFNGPIITTRLTARLLDIMLRDSAHIQMSDAAWENRKGKRAGKDLVEPLYTEEDAVASMSLVQTYNYGEETQLCEGIRLRFVDAGHLLGSAMVELWVNEDGEERKIVFSGDIGNIKHPVIRDPSRIDEADYVVMESTYGDREHGVEGEYTLALAEILDETFAKGGTVVIPSFAVGRTQELLYDIRQIKEMGLVDSVPNFPVYVDSPLAFAATRIYSGDLTGYIDDEAMTLVAGGVDMFTFPGLRLCSTTEESQALNDDLTPKVIISASGMCDAGRIRHHLKHNLWRYNCAVVFVGFQAQGSFGRHLLEGATSVKMFGEEIAVNARIINLRGLSSHADRPALLGWISAFEPKPRHIFVVHGAPEVAPVFADTLMDMGFEAHAPELTEEYDLIENRLQRHGFTPQRKKPAVRGDTPAFLRLVSLGRKLTQVIDRSRGMANKELAKFADQLSALIAKWDR